MRDSPPVLVAVIVDTLRMIAIHDGMQPAELVDLAWSLEQGDWRDADIDGAQCPICEGLTCEPGCPLLYLFAPPGEPGGLDQPNAMINEDGDVFYPDKLSTALQYVVDHDARPVHGQALIDFLSGLG